MTQQKAADLQFFAEVPSPIRSMCSFGATILAATEEGVIAIHADGTATNVTDQIDTSLQTND